MPPECYIPCSTTIRKRVARFLGSWGGGVHGEDSSAEAESLQASSSRLERWLDRCHGTIDRRLAEHKPGETDQTTKEFNGEEERSRRESCESS